MLDIYLPKAVGEPVAKKDDENELLEIVDPSFIRASSGLVIKPTSTKTDGIPGVFNTANPALWIPLKCTSLPSRL